MHDYSKEEYNLAKKLYGFGWTYRQIVRHLGERFKSPVVRSWATKDFKIKYSKGFHPHQFLQQNPLIYLREDLQKSYAFILGEYLGDGHIAKGYGYSLKIYNDKKHEGLNQLIEKHLSVIFPCNGIARKEGKGCWAITVSNPLLRHLFPQHGKGRKHSRLIQLTDWQRQILAKYPKEFLTGLFYSDGSIYRGKNHWNYSFCNTSKDIIDIFLHYLKLIGVETNRTINPRKPLGHGKMSLYSIAFCGKNDRQILQSFLKPRQNITKDDF